MRHRCLPAKQFTPSVTCSVTGKAFGFSTIYLYTAEARFNAALSDLRDHTGAFYSHDRCEYQYWFFRALVWYGFSFCPQLSLCHVACLPLYVRAVWCVAASVLPAVFAERYSQEKFVISKESVYTYNMMLKMVMELDTYQKHTVQNTPSRLPPVQSLNLSACMIQYLLLMSLAAVIPRRASLGKQLGLPDCKLFHLHRASCCVG